MNKKGVAWLSIILYFIHYKAKSIKTELIPRSTNKQCPSNSRYKDGLGTCSCEDHCGWDVCRLVKAPDDCLLGTLSEWHWDTMKNGWVAQVVLGSVK